jgi:hypothetical protein
MKPLDYLQQEDSHLTRFRTLLPVLLIFAAFGLISSGSASASTPTLYTNGFETDIAGWFTPTRVASGSLAADGISSASGAFHANATTDYTSWNGYTTEFPAAGYKTAIDVYLNPGNPGYVNDTRFDWTSAVSTPAGAHRRDFVFNAGFYNNVDSTGSAPRFVISASNNAGRGGADPENPGRNPIAITTPGWYTLQHSFHNDGSGVLAVDLSIITPNGTTLHTWSLSDPTDVIGATVGGNRYGWFATNEFPYLAIDNTRLLAAWPFAGFYSPVNNDALNTVKAGAAVPVKFSLGGDRGLAIMATGSPSSQTVNCDTGDPVDAIEETVTAGGSSLSYDTATSTYVYVWKTQKAWAGTCRELTVELIDGTTHTATFKLLK